jgi:hypothetical protein
MNLFILRHISFVTEVVKVSSIGLGIEFRDKWSTLGTNCFPINFGKIVVVVDFLNGRESLRLRCNAPIGSASLQSERMNNSLDDKVPSTVTDKIGRIFPNWSFQDFSPVLQVLPSLINCGSCERRKPSQGLEVHTPQTPIVD